MLCLFELALARSDIMLLKSIKKERVEFRLEVFFGSSLN